MLLLLLVLATAALAAVWQGLNALDSVPVNIIIDGERVVSGFDIAGMSPAHKLVLAAGLLFVVLTAAVLVPVALLIALSAMLGGLLLVVGLPLLAAVAAVTLVLSPLILLVWLLWRALRRPPASATA
ncbi:MAG: hypothetical protein OEW22_04755 [Rubrivivax sp.]|nr:hypothetical protein [Rubrivivax sp.]